MKQDIKFLLAGALLFTGFVGVAWAASNYQGVTFDGAGSITVVNLTGTGSLSLDNGAITSDGAGTLSLSRAQIGDGTVTNPSLGFTSDDDGTGVGFYRIGANQFGSTVNGVLTFAWGTGGLAAQNAMQFLADPDDDPGLSFSGDADTGIGRPTALADTLEFHAGGTVVGTLDASEFVVGVPVRANRGIQDKTTGYALATTDLGDMLTNAGAGATDVLFPLPAIASGLTFTIVQVDSGTVGFDPPAGTNILWDGSATAMDDGEQLESSAAGSWATVTAGSGTLWFVRTGGPSAWVEETP